MSRPTTKGMMEIKLTNLPQVVKQLQGIQRGGEEAIERTVKDFRGRAPAWVSRAVRKYYGIPAKEISPKTKKDVENKVKKAGQIYSRGKTLSTMAIVYYGRVLTPARFNMQPKLPNKTYSIKVTIQKGRRRRLGGKKALTKAQKTNIGRNFTHQGKRNRRKYPILLKYTGAKGEGKIPYIPMRLLPNDKWHVIRSVSLPQMVENKRVQEEIYKEVDANLSKRLEHHIEKCINKYAK